MNLKDRQLDCKFNPRAALDFVQLAPPGIDARVKVIDEDTVEVTPSFPVKIESGWLNFVKIERLDSLFGETMEITDGEITADKKYRFTNLF